MSTDIRADFQLTEELHKTIVKSLVTSFGLDFLLFEDKKGGDVATIHNVRKHQQGDKDIYIPDHIQHQLKNDPYGSAPYHTHLHYKEKGKEDKKQQQAGQLHDSYRVQTMGKNENRQLDHIISAKEIHNDAGRLLAGLDGVELANQGSNFQSTHAYINNLKSASSIDHFVDEVLPKTLEKKRVSIASNQDKLESMPTKTAQQRNEKRKLEDRISKDKEHLEVLESIDTEQMKKMDKFARKKYDAQINHKYYASSKFFTDTACASAISGIKMGLRQALGLILAEVWFELKESLPLLYKENKSEFKLDEFLGKIKKLFSDIWSRVQNRFKNFLTEFKDGAIAGALSSVTTTVTNIFLTTQKTIGKLIREVWSSLVSAAKLLFFNPQKLEFGDLTKEVIRILLTGISVAMGVILNQHLASFMNFPFGTELAAFISAVVTGMMTLGISYFLDHSDVMQKVWSYLNRFKSNAKRTLEYFQKVNAELDRYLLELAEIEFNFNPQELACFADNLAATNSEYEKSLILSQEIEKRAIELPFESKNLDSARDWLNKL